VTHFGRCWINAEMAANSMRDAYPSNRARQGSSQQHEPTNVNELTVSILVTAAHRYRKTLQFVQDSHQRDVALYTAVVCCASVGECLWILENKRACFWSESGDLVLIIVSERLIDSVPTVN